MISLFWTFGDICLMFQARLVSLTSVFITCTQSLDSMAAGPHVSSGGARTHATVCGRQRALTE